MDVSEPTPAHASTGAQPGLRGVARRRIVIALAAWVAVAGAAIGIAKVMDDEPARPVALVAHPPSGLPPLRLYLDRDLPADVEKLGDANAQAKLLQQKATQGNNPARWVELGALAQAAADLPLALAAYRQALVIAPGRLDATVGVQMVDGATGTDGLNRAEGALEGLRTANPGSQLVLFNEALVAIYRGAPKADINRLFVQTVALGPGTNLGKLARRFADAATRPSANP